MRAESAIIKRILVSEFPDSKISVRLICARNYVDTSDKLRVFVSGATFTEVYDVLRHYTQGVAIYKAGDVASCGGRFAAAALDPETREWVSLDCCEFIEIHTEANK